MRIPDKPNVSKPVDVVKTETPKAPAAEVREAKAPAAEVASAAPSAEEVQGRRAEAAIENAAARAGMERGVPLYGGPAGGPAPEGSPATEFSGPGRWGDYEKLPGLANEGATFGAPPKLPDVPERTADRAITRMSDLRQRATGMEWSEMSRKLWARQRWPEAELGPRPEVITKEVAAAHPEVKMFDQAQAEAVSRFDTARQFYRRASIAIHEGNQEMGNYLHSMGETYEAAGKQSLETAEKIYGAAKRRDQGLKNLAEASLAAPKGLAMEAAMMAVPGVLRAVKAGGEAAARLAGMGLLVRPLFQTGKQAAPALARLGFDEYLQAARMNTAEAKQFLTKYHPKATDQMADDFITYSKGQVMDQALQDGRKFSRLTAQEVSQFTGGAIRQSEANGMLQALQAANPDAMAAHAAKLEGLQHCAGIPERAPLLQKEASEDLQRLLLNEDQLARTKPGALRSMASQAGLEMSEAQAKVLVKSADANVLAGLRRLTPDGAIESLLARGDVEGAKRVESFLAEMGGHTEVVRVGGKHFNGRVFGSWKGASAEDLVKRYAGKGGENLTESEAKALLAEYKQVDGIELGYHDLGPAGKTDPHVMFHMSRPGRKGTGDFLMDDAIDLHNTVFAHHGPGDPRSRFENAVDYIAAMKQDRSYRDGFSWQKLNNEFLPQEFAKIRASGRPDAEAQIAWLKVASKEMENMERLGINLKRPQDEFIHLKTPAPYLPKQLG